MGHTTSTCGGIASNNPSEKAAMAPRLASDSTTASGPKEAISAAACSHCIRVSSERSSNRSLRSDWALPRKAAPRCLRAARRPKRAAACVPSSSAPCDQLGIERRWNARRKASAKQQPFRPVKRACHGSLNFRHFRAAQFGTTLVQINREAATIGNGEVGADVIPHADGAAAESLLPQIFRQTHAGFASAIVSARVSPPKEWITRDEFNPRPPADSLDD